MDVNIVDKSSWQKMLEVSIPYTDLATDFEKAYKEYKKKIRLEGFRKGKVPINIIKNIYGKEIEAKAAEDKIPDVIDQICKEHKFKFE